MSSESQVSGTGSATGAAEGQGTAQATGQETASSFDFKGELGKTFDEVVKETPEFKDFKGFESVKDFKGLVKSYVSAQKMVGSAVHIPDEKATPEDQAKFWQKLGLPEKLDDYKVQIPQGLSEAGFDENLMKGLIVEAHKSGIVPKHLQAVLNWYGTSLSARNKAISDGAASERAELKTHWGPNYDRQMALGDSVARMFGGSMTAETDKDGKPIGPPTNEAMRYLNAIGADTNPIMRRFLANVGAQFREHRVDLGDLGGQAAVDIKKEYDTLIHSEAYTKWDAPGHSEAVAKATKLREAMYGAANR